MAYRLLLAGPRKVHRSAELARLRVIRPRRKLRRFKRAQVELFASMLDPRPRMAVRGRYADKFSRGGQVGVAHVLLLLFLARALAGVSAWARRCSATRRTVRRFVYHCRFVQRLGVLRRNAHRRELRRVQRLEAAVLRLRLGWLAVQALARGGARPHPPNKRCASRWAAAASTGGAACASAASSPPDARGRPSDGAACWPPSTTLIDRSSTGTAAARGPGALCWAICFRR